ncbi:hypothetical protein NKH77_07585 [Streptomyces sp. M19]
MASWGASGPCAEEPPTAGAGARVDVRPPAYGPSEADEFVIADLREPARARRRCPARTRCSPWPPTWAASGGRTRPRRDPPRQLADLGQHR